jgi:hypothetical protein
MLPWQCFPAAINVHLYDAKPCKGLAIFAESVCSTFLVCLFTITYVSHSHHATYESSTDQGNHATMRPYVTQLPAAKAERCRR